MGVLKFSVEISLGYSLLTSSCHSCSIDETKTSYLWQIFRPIYFPLVTNLRTDLSDTPLIFASSVALIHSIKSSCISIICIEVQFL